MTRQFDLKSLRLFADVCRLESFSRAAEAANLETSTVSKRIAQLEATAAVPLLERASKGVRPTAAGRLVLQQGKAILDAAERMSLELAELRTGERSQLRLLAPTSALASPLLNDIASFVALEPHRGAKVAMEECPTGEVVRRVLEDAGAVGVCWGTTEARGLATRPYRAERLMLAVPAFHPLAREAEVRFADTLGYPQVGLGSGSALQSSLEGAAVEAGGAIDNRFIVSNFDVALRVVEAGLAIGVVPKETLARSDRGAVRAVALRDAWAQRRFALCFQRFEALSGDAQSLVLHLEARGRA